MSLESRYYREGMKTYINPSFPFVSSLCKNETTLKHSFSLFQACVNMKLLSSTLKHSFSFFQACLKLKPISSIVFHVLSLCKNEIILILSFVIVIFISLFFPDEPSLSIVTICLVNHTLSPICFTLS